MKTPTTILCIILTMTTLTSANAIIQNQSGSKIPSSNPGTISLATAHQQLLFDSQPLDNNPDNVLSEYFDGYGIIVQGVECILFKADTGVLYLLDNQGNFQIGDYVRVRGILNTSCATICLQGDACIEYKTISTCLRADLNGDNNIDIDDFPRTHPKTCFVTRPSDKSVVKAGGEKGAAFTQQIPTTMIYKNILARPITLKGVFADNADPRALQPIAVERGFGMDSIFLSLWLVTGCSETKPKNQNCPNGLNNL